MEIGHERGIPPDVRLGEIAASIDAEVEGDPGLEIDEIAPLESAGP
ncbi:MAG: hypothetical protein ACKPBU_12445 [Alphaproteobacteria bacterium]